MALQPNPVYQPEKISRGTLQAVSQGRKKRSSESSEDDAEELNEALMRTAITEQGRHPYRYGIASVNFKGDTRGTGNAALRKLLLGQLQGQTRVSILFVQECPWRDPVEQLQLGETFCYTGVINEAGIIWNTELFELKRLDSYKLIGDNYSNLIQHRARVCISEMSIKHQPTELTATSDIAEEEAPNVSNFTAISWHGPHKCSEKEKQRIFRDLLAFLKTQTVTNDGQALVIGGDFNFRLDKACGNIDDSYPGLTIPTSYGCETTIDYFIFTSDLINILHAQHLSLGDDVGSVYTTLDRDRAKAEACKIPSDQIIDHRPVFAVLDLGRPNPFSSPSVLRETTERRITRTDVPGCSTDGSDRSSLQSSTRKEARQATNMTRGSTSLQNNTRNTQIQEAPTETEETGEARPAKEAPDGAKGAAAAEEGETDEKEPTEAKGTHNVNIGVKDDGQVQEPSDKSLDTSASPSPGVTEKRKQAEDSNTGPSIKRTNTGRQTKITDFFSTVTRNPVRHESGRAPGTGAGPVRSVPPGISAERTGASSSFPCQEEGCNYKARSKGALETHMRREHTEKKYECDKCDFKTAHQSGLKRHRTRKHPAN